MIVNPGKFQGIIIDKKKQNHTAEYISINQKNIKTSSSVKRLGVHQSTYYKNLQILGKPTLRSNKALEVTKLWRKETLSKSYFYSNFNYCPVVWMFSSAKSLNKV